MPNLFLDTHSLVWCLSNRARLSQAATREIDAAIAAGDTLYVSSISFAEVLYLQEKHRLPVGSLDLVIREVRRADSAFAEVPLIAEVVTEMRNVPRAIVPDLPDRVIAASSVFMGVPLVTADGDIHRAGIPVIW
jgi:PIN domain nuclease of toxin-antitoxin system